MDIWDGEKWILCSYYPNTLFQKDNIILYEAESPSFNVYLAHKYDR